MDDVRWNHNIHYQRLVLDRVPVGTHRALDVDCGEGILTRELHQQIPHVVGIDRDPGSIARARQAGGDVDYVESNIMSYAVEPFDFIASISALHHMDTAQGLTKLADLLRPGGRLVVIGCAKRSLPHDLPWEIAGAVTTRALKLRYGYWQHRSPIADPPLTHRQTKRIATEALPGARYRQLALWRYLLDWTAP